MDQAQILQTATKCLTSLEWIVNPTDAKVAVGLACAHIGLDDGQFREISESLLENLLSKNLLQHVTSGVDMLVKHIPVKEFVKRMAPNDSPTMSDLETQLARIMLFWGCANGVFAKVEGLKISKDLYRCLSYLILKSPTHDELWDYALDYDECITALCRLLGEAFVRKATSERLMTCEQEVVERCRFLCDGKLSTAADFVLVLRLGVDYPDYKTLYESAMRTSPCELLCEKLCTKDALVGVSRVVAVKWIKIAFRCAVTLEHKTRLVELSHELGCMMPCIKDFVFEVFCRDCKYIERMPVMDYSERFILACSSLEQYEVLYAKFTPRADIVRDILRQKRWDVYRHLAAQPLEQRGMDLLKYCHDVETWKLLIDNGLTLKVLSDKVQTFIPSKAQLFKHHPRTSLWPLIVRNYALLQALVCRQLNKSVMFVRCLQAARIGKLDKAVDLLIAHSLSGLKARVTPY